MTAITQYYAKVGLSVDMMQLKKVDSYLKAVERKLEAFQKKTMAKPFMAKAGLSVDINQLKKLDRYLQLAERKIKGFKDRVAGKNGFTLNVNFKIDKDKLFFHTQKSFVEVSKRTRFPIENFIINKNFLAMQIASAVRSALHSVPKNINLSAKVTPQVQKVNQAVKVTGQPQHAPSARPQTIGAGGAGLLGGGIGRFGLASLPFIGGAFGMGQLNQANQSMVSANIAAESVLGATSNQMLDWLSQRANFLGVSYADTLPQFTKFMASSTPLMGQEASKDVFSSFMQFGRTRGADKVSMNRALTAVGQMSAKGQVMAEELKNQLGDAAGFGELPQLFAEAFQIKTGGSLKGAEARGALIEAMKEGQVKTSDILPIVSKLMDELSKGGVERARKSSVAEQMRAENMLIGRGGTLQLFSEAGGESGFARLWRTASDSLREINRSMPDIGKFFDKGTQFVRQIVLLPQSIARMFQGRDSNFQKWLFGEGETGEKVMTWMFNVKDIFKEFAGLGEMAFKGWKMIFDLMKDSGTFDAILDKIIELQRALILTLQAIQKAGQGDFSGAMSGLKDAILLGAPDMVTGALLGFKSQEEVDAEKARIMRPFKDAEARRNALRNPESVHFNDPKGYDDFKREMQIAAQADFVERTQQKLGNVPGITKIEVKLDANITAENANDFAGKVVDVLNREISKVMPNYSNSSVQIPLVSN